MDRHADLIMATVERMFDSDEKRMIKMGEFLIHHGTMHCWRNPSQTETASTVLFEFPVEKSAD